QAIFELEEVLEKERDAQVTLAESIGIPPTTPIQLTDFAALPPPAELQDTVEKAIDRALEKRPDLIERVAALHASEAELSRHRAVAARAAGGRLGLHPGQRADHRRQQVHRVVQRGPTELWHRVVPRVGALRWRIASAPGRAGRIGASGRPG